MCNVSGLCSLFPISQADLKDLDKKKERRKKGEKKESRAVKREREKGDEQKRVPSPFLVAVSYFPPQLPSSPFFIPPSHTPLSISGASAVAATIKHSAPHCSWGTKKAARIPLACKTHYSY